MAARSSAQDLTRLQNLLAGLPEGGWVQVNTNTLSSAFPTGLAAVPASQGYNDPRTIVPAWSSVAWDSTRGSLLLFGGGHANYSGNEMYVWDAASGLWSRGSLPSRIDLATTQNFIVDNAAPQSVHTYDNNVFLPVNDRFLSFGGAGFPNGLPFLTNINGVTQNAGPWIWDPSKADPDKVGGTDGSGYAPGSIGGQMWVNRAGQSTGSPIPTFFVNGTTAVRVEGGKDTVYVTVDQNSWGLPDLYRYTVGNLALGETDQWVRVGRTFTGSAQQGAGTLDNINNFYIRTGFSNAGADLHVWQLSAFNGTTPINNVAVRLEFADGSPFVMAPNSAYGLDFDQQSGRLIMWGGNEQGAVYYVQPSVAPNGAPNPVWTVTFAYSSTVEQPTVTTLRGVLGKWDYIDQLDAYLAVEEFSGQDAKVWLYKPYNGVVAVPEPASLLMWLFGGGLMLVYLGRRRLNHQR